MLNRRWVAHEELVRHLGEVHLLDGYVVVLVNDDAFVHGVSGKQPRALRHALSRTTSHFLKCRMRRATRLLAILFQVIDVGRAVRGMLDA